MKRTESGTFRIDPSPEINVFRNQADTISIEIDDEFLVVPPGFAKSIGEALIALAKEIEEEDSAE